MRCDRDCCEFQNSEDKDPPPLGIINGVVPQQRYRYLNSRLQDKITEVLENGLKGRMSPSPYDLGYKSKELSHNDHIQTMISFLLYSKLAPLLHKLLI